jgi:hypothetical protein
MFATKPYEIPQLVKTADRWSNAQLLAELEAAETAVLSNQQSIKANLELAAYQAVMRFRRRRNCASF